MFRFSIVAFLAVAGFNASAEEVLATYQDSYSVGANRIVPNSVSTFYMSTNLTESEASETSRIFSELVINLTDVGQSFVVDAMNEPEFTEFASRMTDGLDEWLFIDSNIVLMGGSGLITPESYFFHDGLGGIDLNGNVLSSVRLTVDEFSFEIPGRDGNGDGIWTDYSIAYTVEFMGHAVPEPISSLACLAIGTIALARRRRHS